MRYPREILLSEARHCRNPVHIKVTYHDRDGRSTIVSTDLEESKQIKELVLRDILVSTSGAGENMGNTNTFDLDTHEDKLIPTWNNEFKYIHLSDNLARSVKIGFGLVLEVRATLIEYL